MTMVLNVNAHNVHYPTYTEDGITYVKEGLSNSYIDGEWYEKWSIQKVDKPNDRTITIPHILTIDGDKKIEIYDIKENAFATCVSLDSLILSDGFFLQQDTKGFKGCRKLEYLYYSSSCCQSYPDKGHYMEGLSCKTLETYIGSPERSFWNSIGDSIEKLIIRGEHFFGVFKICKNLRTIICYSDKAPSVSAPVLGYSCEDNKFQSWQWSTITLYVPRESLEKYYFDRVWGEIDNIYAIDEMNSATTSINHITDKVMENNAWYTINGTKIDNPTKGIYIKNGKKYIIK
jgi:hypothetical protein